VRPSELDDSVLSKMPVGVTASVEEETDSDEGNTVQMSMAREGVVTVIVEVPR
jgi:hypothetical protein